MEKLLTVCGHKIHFHASLNQHIDDLRCADVRSNVNYHLKKLDIQPASYKQEVAATRTSVILTVSFKRCIVQKIEAQVVDGVQWLPLQDLVLHHLIPESKSSRRCELCRQGLCLILFDARGFGHL
jgi:hypothetical protein